MVYFLPFYWSIDQYTVENSLGRFAKEKEKRKKKKRKLYKEKKNKEKIKRKNRAN